MKEPLKVTVVIPAYNEEEIISRAIESVLGQKFDGCFELIVVDNNSQDRTLEIAKKYQLSNPEKVAVLTEKSQGVCFARATGAKNAKGCIIAFLDADCEAPEDWLKKGVAQFDNKKIAAISGPYEFQDCSKTFRKNSLFFTEYVLTTTHHLLRAFGKGGFTIGGNSFVRRKSLEKIGGYDLSAGKYYGEDTALAKSLSRVGKVLYLPNFLVSSSSRRFHKIGAFRLVLIYTITVLSIAFFGMHPPFELNHKGGLS